MRAFLRYQLHPWARTRWFGVALLRSAQLGRLALRRRQLDRAELLRLMVWRATHPVMQIRARRLVRGTAARYGIGAAAAAVIFASIASPIGMGNDGKQAYDLATRTWFGSFIGAVTATLKPWADVTAPQFLGGAKGNNINDDTPPIGAAYAAAPDGSVVYFPRGTYSVLGAGTQAILLGTNQTTVHTFGDGHNSWIRPAPAFPTTRDIIRIAVTSQTRDWTFYHLRLGGGASALGRHALHFDNSDAGNVAQTYGTWVARLLIDPMATGNSIYLHSIATSTSGGFFYSQIWQCFAESVLGQFIGDTVSIEDNFFAGTPAAVDVSQVSGAGGFRVVHNTSANTAGQVIFRNGVSPHIADNTMEQTVNCTEANGAMIDITGDAGTVWHPQILNNQVQVLTGITGVTAAVRCDIASNPQIDGNRIDIQAGNHVVLTANCQDAYIGAGQQFLTNHVIGAMAISDLALRSQYGFGTYLESDIGSGAAVVLTTNTPANLTSIVLPPGDWDVRLSLIFTGGGTTTVTILEGSLSTVSATRDFTEGRYAASPEFGNAGGLAFLPNVNVGPQRFSLAAQTTIYGVAFATFGVAACSVYGRLSARRIA